MFLSRLVRRLQRKPPLRLGDGGPIVGYVDAVLATPAGLSATATITDPELLEHLSPGDQLQAYSIRPPRTAPGWGAPRPSTAPLPLTSAEVAAEWLEHAADVALEPWQRRALGDLLHVADPNPALERVRALAAYSQLSSPPEHPDEHLFAWRSFNAAGGAQLTPWRAFQAGLRAAVAWAELRRE